MATQASERADLASSQPLQAHLQGLLLFRLLIAVFFLVLTILVQYRRAETLLAAELEPLYLFSAILFVYTIMAGLSLSYIRRLKAFAYQQLLFDVLAVTILIYLSGGVESIFSFLYLLVIIASAVLLFRPGSMLIASASSLCYGGLLDLQFFHWISPRYLTHTSGPSADSGTYFYAILMNISVFYLTAYVSGYLAEELARSKRRLEKQQEDLSRIEALHRNIVNSMTSGLLTLDDRGRIVYANPAAEAILGVSEGNLGGCDIRWFFSNVNEALREAAMDGVESGRYEVLYEGHGNTHSEPLWIGYTLSALNLASAGERLTGWVLIFKDLTKFKSLEEHAKRQEKLAFAGRVAAEIVHEIKNPLASMSGAVELLRSDLGESPLQVRLADIVSREIERVNHLVTNFLWLAKGAQKTRPCAVNLTEAVQEVLELVQTHEKYRPAHVIQRDFALAAQVWMDPDHFRQILFNILINGLEAMPDGGELSIATMRSQIGADGPLEVRLDISDTGAGIPPEAMEQIFEPFFTTKEKGTGLGLSIVYQLVDQAGGRISVQSHPEQGSTFSMFFPISCVLSLVKPD